jgi:hypothetical protein
MYSDEHYRQERFFLRFLSFGVRVAWPRAVLDFWQSLHSLVASSIWEKYGLSTVLGALAGLGSAFGVTVWSEQMKRNAERKRFAAMAAESFNAIAEHLRRHRVRQLLASIAQELPQNRNVFLIIPIFPGLDR